jgi:hypothetical protein
MADEWDQFKDAPAADPYGQFKDAAPVKAAPAKPKRSVMDDVSGGLATVYRGTGLGDEFAAEMLSKLRTGAGLLGGDIKLDPHDVRGSMKAVNRQSYDTELAKQRQMEGEFAKAHPNVHGLLTGLGNAVPLALTMGESAAPQVAAPVLKTGLKALPGAVARGIGQSSMGAGVGALTDAGSIPERLTNAGKAMIDPVTVAIGAATGGIGVPKGKVAKQKPAAELVADLRQEAQGLYKSLDQMGASFRPDSLRDLGRQIFAEVSPTNRPGGVHPTLSPNAFATLRDEVMPHLTSGQPMSMTVLDELRQVVRNSTTGPNSNKNDRRLGYAMLNKIDDFVRSAGPHNFAVQATLPWQPGAAQAKAQSAQMALAQARTLWGRAAKVENITNRVTSAVDQAATTDSGKNVANKIRQKLQPLRDPTKPRQVMQGLSEAQAAQLKKTTKPGLGEDVLRQVGKMDPSRGGLMSLGGLGLAIAHPGTIPAMAGTMVARVAGDKVVQRNVDKLVSMIATGDANAKLAMKQLQSQMASNPQVAAYMQQLRDTAARTGGFSRGQAQEEPQARQ